MSNEALKVSCVLEGDRAIDFERLSMEFKAGNYKASRSKQQAAMIGAAMLVLDSVKQKCAHETGKRYPTLVEVLAYAQVPNSDINCLIGVSDAVGEESIASISAAIGAASGKSQNGS